MNEAVKVHNVLIKLEDKLRRRAASGFSPGAQRAAYDLTTTVDRVHGVTFLIDEALVPITAQAAVLFGMSEKVSEKEE